MDRRDTGVTTRHKTMKHKISWKTLRATFPAGTYTEMDTPADQLTAQVIAENLAHLLTHNPTEAVAINVRYGHGVFVPGFVLRQVGPRTERRLAAKLRSTLPNYARDLCGNRVRDYRTRFRPQPRQTNDRASVRARWEHVPLRPNAEIPLTTRTAFPYSHALGIEFESVGPIDRPDLIARLPMWTRCVSDGSIRAGAGNYGHEIRALLDRQTAEPRLHRLCKIMADAGLSVNRSTGLHVHLDARNIPSQTEAVRLAKVIDSWLFQLRELVPASRRENSYCKFGVCTRDRYRAVNVMAWDTHRTIEVRLHSGTVDYTKTLAWIRLLETIRAVARKPKPASSCLATLDQLPLTDYERAYWRGRHQALNPTLYTTTAPTTTAEAE
jgi:hypothetical protein